MNIPIPLWLVRSVDVTVDWLNSDAVGKLRRLDLVAMAFFLATIAWYGQDYGWQGVAYGGATVVAGFTLGLCLRRE